MPRKKATPGTNSSTKSSPSILSILTTSAAISKKTSTSIASPILTEKDNIISTQTTIPQPSTPIPTVPDPALISVDGALPVSTTNFRVQGKSIFLTFPQCNTTKEEAADRIRKSNKFDVAGFVVSQEKHEDGNDHLHVVIKFTKRINVRRPDFFNFIGGKQANVQRVKIFNACVAYVAKTDNYVAHEINVPEILASQAKKNEDKKKKQEKKNILIYEAAIAGKSYDDILLDPITGPYCVLHGKQVRSLLEDLTVVANKKQRLNERPPYLHLILNGREFDMLCGLPFKTPQFWICGPPNVGKTTLIRKLMDTGLKGFQIPTNNDFARWDDNLYDFAYIDEFKGQLTIQFLNEFLQGSIMHLPGKYVIGGKVKNKNVPCFILSNYSPQQCYHKKSELDLQPLLARLNIFELQSYNNYEIVTHESRDNNGSPLHINDIYDNN